MKKKQVLHVPNFWETKSLSQMNNLEWEMLCDGCGKCCLHKFVDDNESEVPQSDQVTVQETIHYTNIACELLNTKTCACSNYQQRTELVPECMKLSKDKLDALNLLPLSCSYRRINEGRGLPSWHPLLHKNKKSKMHQLGMSIRGKTVFEHDVDMEQFEDYIALWPMLDEE